MSDEFEFYPEYELDKEALRTSAAILTEAGGRRYDTWDVSEVVTTFLNELEPRERDFSPAMLRAKHRFKERCAAEPDECPQAIWEQLMAEKDAAQ